MDSNLVARVNVDAYCPKIRKKQQNVHSHVGCPKPSVWEMEITVYPLHRQSIGPISTALNRGRLVTSIRHDTTASEPILTRWASNMGGKTHLIQACPKDLCFSLHSPFIHDGRQNKLDSAEIDVGKYFQQGQVCNCLLYTSPSPRDISGSRMPSSA